MGVPFSACLPRARCTALACLALLHGAAAAQTPPAGIEYKFTPTHLHSSDGNHALDLNLRAGSGPHIGWVGIYRDRQGYQQARLGYEYRMEIDGARIAWSLQYAQRGFVGASVTAEVGGDTFAIVGADRFESLQSFDRVGEILATVQEVLGAGADQHRRGPGAVRLDAGANALHREIEIVDRLRRIAARVFDRSAGEPRAGSHADGLGNP